MKYRLRRIGVLKAGLMYAVFCGIISLLFVPFFFFAAMIPSMAGDMGHMGDAGWMFGPAFALLLPLIYAFFGFIGGALGALVFNLVAMMVGGLEIELEPTNGGDVGAQATY